MPKSVSRDSELPTTLVMPAHRPPRMRISRKADKVSAVSPLCEMATYSVWRSTIGFLTESSAASSATAQARVAVQQVRSDLRAVQAGSAGQEHHVANVEQA